MLSKNEVWSEEAEGFNLKADNPGSVMIEEIWQMYNSPIAPGDGWLKRKLGKEGAVLHLYCSGPDGLKLTWQSPRLASTEWLRRRDSS